MPTLPDKTQQIVQTHAALIHRVVMACHNRTLIPDLEPVLKMAAEHGWTGLVAAIRLILAGRRDPGVLAGLDEEDTVIAEAMLRGLQNPATLPDPNARPDPALAAPGLASMIQGAASGNRKALQLIAAMAEQMSKVGGDMARLAAVIRPLINGERDPERLCKGMSAQGQNLVLMILEELGRTGLH
jgi:hypothetical protein